MIRKFGILFLLLAFVACSSDDKPDEPAAEAPKAEKPEKPGKPDNFTANLICPQVAILQKAQETFDYAGEQPDPSQLVAKVRMKALKGDCAYTKDGIDITFTVHMVAARGPRLGKQVSFPYFIGIVDPAENIISRQILTAHFAFGGDDKTATLDEPLHVFIPLSHAAILSGPDYRVLVGFQLPKNRRKID